MPDDPQAIAGSSVAPTDAAATAYAGAVREVSRRSLLEALGEAVDRAAPGLKDAFLAAIADAVDGVDYRQLRRALAAGDLDEALGAIPFEDLQAALAKLAADGERPGPLAGPFNAGVEMGLHSLPAHVAVELDHREIRSEAAAWLRERGAELAQSLTDETRAGMRELLAGAMERGGRDVYDLARDVSKVLDAQTVGGLLGLNERQAVALNSYAEALGLTDRADLPDAALRGAVEGRYREMLDYRGETIAITEAAGAGRAGQQDVWQDAVDQGKLDGEAYEIERVEAADCCDECDAVDGERRPIDGDYENDDANDWHPRCRGQERLVGAEEN